MCHAQSSASIILHCNPSGRPDLAARPNIWRSLPRERGGTFGGDSLIILKNHIIWLLARLLRSE
jgi:hypothetical protein